MLYDNLISVINEELMPRFRTKIEDLLVKIPIRGTGQQITAFLKNNGVTDEEIRWTKLNQILKQDKVFKQEIIDHLASHGMPFKAVDSGEKHGNRYQQYALKGGRNYGEKLFTLNRDEPFKLEWDRLPEPEYGGNIKVQFNGHKPGADRSGRFNAPDRPVAQVFIEKSGDGITIEARVQDEDGDWAKIYTTDGKNVEIENTDSAMMTFVEQAKIACEKKLGNYLGSGEYTSSHWQEKNPIFHVRHQEFKDADGKNLWLIEEIQSDHHQAGRKSGYSDGKKKFQVLHNNNPLPVDLDSGNEFSSKEEAERYVKDSVPARMHDRITYRSYGPGGIPNAPMKKTWEEMAFKWALHQAVEAGADRIGWITGEIAADRFDIAKQVDHIRLLNVSTKYPHVWEKDKKAGVKPYRLLASRNGENVIDKRTDEDGLADIIGKDVARKLLDQPEGDHERELKGTALKVGGEGMKAAYDQRIVSIAKKIAKITGAMVGKVMLEDAEDEGEEIDPYEMTNVEIKYGSETSPIYDNKEEYEEDERDEEERGKAGFWLTFDGEKVEGTERYAEYFDAVAAKERLGTVREAKTGHEVWYMDLNEKTKAMVTGGMRATFESVKPKTVKPWWIV